MPSSDPQKRFGDIVDNIDAIASYTQGMSEEDFFANRLVYDASERCLSRISEAAVKLGLLAEELAPDQPWSDIRGIGNWLRHDYPNIVKQTIWQTITEHLPPLRRSCETAIAKLRSKS
ncbi:HepT-like ribonuclease domain-containing protein [Hyphomicrobium sp. CS1BSMeth3]|uniref:HepT-like ribonuclease domain-containing protein n=1 Tax=Hyphomicrobium sp. CS1BSMeth3 TaxID=1892844 RepID=UPI0009312675|nr:HepT-like ribonuclease domain-containing protein [Hyphomicrobium sp. CS1BSMeth3]